LQSPKLTFAVDMWSLGACICSMLVGGHIFEPSPTLAPQPRDLDVMIQACVVLGAPTEATWEGYASLPGYDSAAARALAAPAKHSSLRKSLEDYKLVHRPWINGPDADVFYRDAPLPELLRWNPAARPSSSACMSRALMRMPVEVGMSAPLLMMGSTLTTQNEHTGLTSFSYVLVMKVGLGESAVMDSPTDT
jgi:serine/threonine protein kinase